MLQCYLQNSTLRVASKIWVGIDVQLHKFYWSVSINNSEKKCKHKSKSDLRHIIFERLMRENFKKGQLSITYGMLNDIFTIIDDSKRPLILSNIPDCLNL